MIRAAAKLLQILLNDISLIKRLKVSFPWLSDNPIKVSWRKGLYYFTSIFRLIFGLSKPVLVTRTFLGLAPEDFKQVKLRGRGLNIDVRGRMDLWSVKETFLDKFYVHYGFPLQDGWQVIDIGAGLGEFSLDAAQGNPKSRIYAFEPFPASYKLLQTNIKQNGLANIQAFNQAIGAERGSLHLDLSEEEPLKIRGLDKDYEEGIEVPALTLADVFEQLPLQQCDLLKLDCEGAEYAILFNAPPETLEKMQRIVMEYHDGMTEHTHKELVSFLEDRGFSVETFSNYVHKNLGYLRARRIGGDCSG
ncbi:MAG: FkbM family methyltransferase [Chloroflexi bacterium]|nr:MAG: FkbM family methyltransferase [Chloroflexota bacterium]MBL1194370.1 FkbM family methyltransferase [Chloroflexota bacterium]NOH11658.1 FkbM family methyltransferase [Chloroflexota bacterium]